MIHGSIAQDSLKILAESLDDLERQRIATDNRIRSLKQVYGYTDDADDIPEMGRLQAIAQGIAELEHLALLDLQKAMRAHPLGPWVKATTGIGEKQGARLLAAVGDPAWNTLHNRDRTISELWAYCGYHVIDGAAPRRAKGQKANWSADAKMRTYLCAEASVKAGVRKLDACDDTHGYDLENRKATTPLGAVYLDRRYRDADAVHTSPCVRCGPAGSPAAPGTPLSGGHKQARALRAVSKAILADMWHAARALREAS